jgi:hypothetical protein
LLLPITEKDEMTDITLRLTITGPNQHTKEASAAEELTIRVPSVTPEKLSSICEDFFLRQLDMLIESGVAGYFKAGEPEANPEPEQTETPVDNEPFIEPEPETEPGTPDNDPVIPDEPPAQEPPPPNPPAQVNHAKKPPKQPKA